MKTYEQALSEGRQKLKEAKITEYDVDGFLLMSEVLNLSRTAYYMKQKDVMADSDYEAYMTAIARRQTYEPLQYITGHAYFMGYDFMVNENVLIPRMDTECLVVEAESILKRKQNAEGGQELGILDMCTGSGCIITSLMLRNSRMKGTGADISSGALKVARENAKRLSCENVSFVQGDLFENITGKYDMIVSNPPYIRTDVITGLMEEVRSHEPYNALDGHADGLYFYREITQKASEFLKEEGFLCYEIGHDQGADVVRIMEENHFKDCRVIKDLAGLDRVVTGHL